MAGPLHQTQNFLEMAILVQWKHRYHLGDTSRYLQSCAPELQFPGTVGSGATSSDTAPDPMFPGTVGSGGANKSSGAVQTLPRTKHGGFQADLLGGPPVKTKSELFVWLSKVCQGIQVLTSQ